MKKTLKLLSVALLTIAMLFTFAQPVCLAAEGDAGQVESVDKIIGSTKTGTTPMSGEVGSIAGTIINWIWGISIIVSIIVLMIIGVQFIVGGAQQKADYKKSLIPVVVGIIIVVFSTTLVKFVFGMRA